MTRLILHVQVQVSINVWLVKSCSSTTGQSKLSVQAWPTKAVHPNLTHQIHSPESGQWILFIKRMMIKTAHPRLAGQSYSSKSPWPANAVQVCTIKAVDPRGQPKLSIQVWLLKVFHPSLASQSYSSNYDQSNLSIRI